MRFLLILLFVSNAFAYFTSALSGKNYEFKIQGPIKERKLGLKYDRVQYITLYNKVAFERAVIGMPAFVEDCHDDGDRFASWSKDVSWSRSFSAGASFELLGIGISSGVDIQKEVSFSIQRWVHSRLGVNAKHTLMVSGYDLEGESYKKIFNSKTGEHKYKKIKNSQLGIPDQRLVLFVEREVLGECN